MISFAISLDIESDLIKMKLKRILKLLDCRFSLKILLDLFDPYLMSLSENNFKSVFLLAVVEGKLTVAKRYLNLTFCAAKVIAHLIVSLTIS